jgi:hypothetical protein
MYELIYNLGTGVVNGLKRLSDNASIPICEDNSDYQDFLAWNKEQKEPLDLKSTIEPIKPLPVRDLAKEIDVIKAQISVLSSKVG